MRAGRGYAPGGGGRRAFDPGACRPPLQGEVCRALGKGPFNFSKTMLSLFLPKVNRLLPRGK